MRMAACHLRNSPTASAITAADRVPAVTAAGDHAAGTHVAVAVAMTAVTTKVTTKATTKATTKPKATPDYHALRTIYP